MKLAYVDMENVIELDYRKATEWIIESPALFQKYVHLLNIQVEGEEGGFVLSDDDVILDISKYVEIVVNPFALDFEDRRIQKKIVFTASENSIWRRDVHRYAEAEC